MTAERELSGPEGTRFSLIRHVEETGSTNADLLAEAHSLSGGGQHRGRDEGHDVTVLVTDHQSAGRGRQARRWHDEPGNSALMSVLLRPPTEWAALMPLIAGMAVVDGVCELVGPDGAQKPGAGSPLALKWPNDVLAPGYGERKLAGILAEATSKGDRLAIVVGMGINVRLAATPPPDVAERAVTVEMLAGRTVDRWDVVRAVLRALDAQLAGAEAGGAKAVLDRYRQYCLTLGRKVRFETPTSVVDGVAVAVDDDGGLVVETATGRVTLNAGEAHHT